MPLLTCTQVLDSARAAIKYTIRPFGTPTLLIHSDNAKDYVSTAVREVVPASGHYTLTSIPYNPGQNGLAERLNGTLLNVTGCIPATTGMYEEYWPFVLCDVERRCWNTNPLYNRHSHNYIALQCTFSYICFWATRIYFQVSKQGNLSPRSRAKLYMEIYDIENIVVKVEDGINHRVKDTDFNPIYPETDLTKTHKMAFASFADVLHHSQTQLSPGASKPLNVSHTHRYLDKNE